MINKKLWLSHESYIEKVLERFNIQSAKPVNSPLVGHHKLSASQCPTSTKGKISNEESTIPICYRQFDVCHGVH